jgi:hypothetical protein
MKYGQIEWGEVGSPILPRWWALINYGEVTITMTIGDKIIILANELQEDADEWEGLCKSADKDVDRMREALDEIASFDAGLLGDGGGGDVEWWRTYIRELLDEVRDMARKAL